MRGARVTTWGCVERGGWTLPVLSHSCAVRAQSTRPQVAVMPSTKNNPGLGTERRKSSNRVRFKRVTVNPGLEEVTTQQTTSQRRSTATKIIGDLGLQFGEAPAAWCPAKTLRRFLDSFGKHEPQAGRILGNLHPNNQGLPLQVARYLLRQRLAQGEKAAQEGGMLHYFGDEWVKWKDSSPKGVEDEELSHWAWILSAENADIAIERFVSDERRKPPFLLNMLVGPDRVIRQADNFVSLLYYIFKHYIGLPHAPHGQSSFHLTWMHFIVLLKRLSFHCLEAWPGLLPSVSRLAVFFIENMPADIRGSQAHAHAIRCEVFNQALGIFAKPPAINPLDDMRFNWEAQKILLGLSSRLQPSLYVTRNGYRSIRRVMAALPKSLREREVAQRAAKTWPPYRRDWDGRDERRRPEDDLSRVARAGILQREAGYSPDPIDRALDIIGGSGIGRAPTIQTRALLPPSWGDDKANLNIYIEWAANIMATRNIREAWSAFNDPPVPHLPANAIVYAEIFKKLFAHEVNDPSGLVLPGDGREIFPVYDGNLSIFEIARITPPKPKELYQMMLFSGVRPTGGCLAVLLRQSASKEAALRYLGDSPYKHLVPVLRESEFGGPDCAKLLPQLPIPILYAWVTMLCRTHIRRPNHGSGARFDASTQIEEAVRLASAYHKHNPVPSETDRVPWYIILEALAAQKVIYSRYGPQYNVSQTLGLFMKIWQRVVSWKGVDDKLFEMLCLVARKSLRLVTFKDTKIGLMHHSANFQDSRWFESRKFLFLQVYTSLRETFKELSVPVREFSATGDDEGRLVTPHKISAVHIYHYMRALGAIEDGPGMVGLMRWVLKAWDEDYLLQAARDPQELGYDYIIRAFSYFISVGSRSVDADTIRDLQQRLEQLRLLRGCSWFWPERTNGEDLDFELDATVANQWTEVRELLDSDDDLLVRDIRHQVKKIIKGVGACEAPPDAM